MEKFRFLTAGESHGKCLTAIIEGIPADLDIDIDLGTKYLTNISAYFLGAIFASDEFVIREGRKVWVAPVRHNKNMV